MLLYNSLKKFIGIDETTLRTVGYNTLDELKEDVEDFADLFDKKPGLIHNFKNFSWIDFLIHSDKKDVQAHIRCNGKVHAASFKVDNFCLTSSDNNSEKAYLVTIKNLELIGEDDGSHPRELLEPELPAPIEMPDLTDPSLVSLARPSESLDQESTLLPTLKSSFDDVTSPNMFADQDTSTEIKVDTPPITPSQQEMHDDYSAFESSPKVSRPAMKTPVDYIYNPSVAANELGLPQDLINEFVGDFIIQSKKFRNELEEAIDAKDFDALQILSHKLKGVAANLRIEDALEVLTTLNTSQDVQELRENLEYYFEIIHLLEFGKQDNHDTMPEEIPLHDSTLKTDEVATIAQTYEETENIPFEDDLGEDMYRFDLLQNEDKEKEYKALSALADELSTEAEELPPLITHDETTPVEYQAPSYVDTANTLTHSEAESFHQTNEDAFSNDETDFDINLTAEELGMDTQDLHTYIHEFVDQANSLKSELETALKSRNFEQVRTIATELKGASEALHMNYASKLLSTMQTSDNIRNTIECAKAFFVFVRQL